MRNRWFALAVLFVGSPDDGVSIPERRGGGAALGAIRSASALADIGWLIGLYFAPGVALALPGGAIGKRFGDKPTVIASLVLMLVGELGDGAVAVLERCRSQAGW